MSDLFEQLEQLAGSAQAGAVVDALIERLDGPGHEHDLFDALMLRCRHRLGLPLQGALNVADLSEEQKDRLGRAQAEACRTVGHKLLERGELVEAWPYFRNVGDAQPVSDALDARLSQPGDDSALEPLLELAWEHGINPRAGFDLMLSSHGLCDAIHSLERKLPEKTEDRLHCIRALTNQMHDELVATLRKQVAEHEAEPDATLGIRQLVSDRRWLFRGGRCHVDDSHLRAVVRFSIVLEAPADLARAEDLAWYGTQLPASFQQGEPPPFEQFFSDYLMLFRGLSGADVDGAVEHFETKLAVIERDQPHRARFPAEVLVFLLARCGRAQRAMQLSVDKLGVNSKTHLAPPLLSLCEAAGEFAPLIEAAREEKQVVSFAAALIAQSSRDEVTKSATGDESS